MTKQHFEAFAREIRIALADTAITPREGAIAARIIANVAQQVNPRFNPDKFFNACTLQSWWSFRRFPARK